CAAGEVDRAGAGAVCRAERLDLLPGCQGVADARQHPVAAAARRFVHDIAGVVDIVGVVTAKPLHDVGADAACSAQNRATTSSDLVMMDAAARQNSIRTREASCVA